MAADAAVPDLIPVRMLNQFIYCPRLFYLEWVQGEFAENADVATGIFQHRRVNREEGSMPFRVAESGEDLLIHARSVLLSSEKHRLIARLDLLEAEGKKATPVEYKKGKIPEVPEKVWEADKIQLCAQGIILRDHGYTCDEGVMYYVESRTRVTVVFSEELVHKTLKARDNAIELASSEKIPQPLVDSPKCPRCSLVGICLPDETNMLGTRVPKEEVRRLVCARQYALPVYNQKQGTTVGKQDERIVVKEKGRVLEEIKLIDISQLCVFGNVQVTTQAMRELLKRDIPVCFFSYGGWFYGYATNLTHKNVELRIKQHEVAVEQEKSLLLSKAFVRGKLKNARTLLRRNHQPTPIKALNEMSRLINKINTAVDAEVLLGIEGAASRVYFSHFAGMIKQNKDNDALPFNFKTRNRRPPTDPVNAMLSFAYALLLKDLFVTLLLSGFDPFLGFYHRPRYGRPALALDLMEEFRAIIADSVVITMLNNNEVKESDFICRACGVSLTEKARRQLVAAYERRMDTLVTHPLFGYKVSYRRVLAVQSRLLARLITGEINEYPTFQTR